MAGKKGSKAEPVLQEASNSQESDTFGSLDHLPEAGQVSSHMPETSSQELPLEVDAIGLQGQGQLSTDVPDEASIEGNFPAVNIAPSGRVSPPNKKGKGSSTAAKGGKAVAKDPKDPKSKDDKDAKDEDKSGKKGGKNANAPPMEAEVDAADVLLSLSMSAARTGTRSGKNPTEAVPPGQPARKRTKADGKDPAATAVVDEAVAACASPAPASAPAATLPPSPALAPAAAVVPVPAPAPVPVPVPAPSPKPGPPARAKKQTNYAVIAGVATKSSKNKEPASGKDTKEKEEAAKEQVQVPAPPETAPPPEIELVPRVMAASPPPPPIAAFIPAISLVVPPPPAEPASGDKRYAAPLPRVEFINPEDLGYVHKFRWEQPEPARKKPKASSWVLPTKKSDNQREKLQTGGVKAGAAPVKRKSAGTFSSVLGAGGGSSSKQPWTKTPVPDVPVMDESNDPELERDENALKRRYELELGHEVQFGHLQIQTSNIKVSFAFEDCAAVPIASLCEHLKKDEFILTDNYKVRVKEKSAASNTEGRTFFGGVQTITMDVWDTSDPDTDGHNTSVRLFGFRDADPEKRHKAQFNGCSCKHGDTLPFFQEVFGKFYKMADIRCEPNSVFSATDNAVMDPRYGLDMEALKLCLERCQEDDTVQNFNLQVTGGVNFSFTAQKGLDKQRTCKPTVQKSGSIQLMLVDAPRRIRLETMRFLLDHCKSAFLPLVQLNLTKRTVDKRQKARRLVEQHRQRAITVEERKADKRAQQIAQRAMGGGSSSKSAVSSATALGMSAVLGLTPPPPPMAAAEMAKLAGGAAHFQQLMAAAQSSGIDFTMALMPGLLAAGGADPFLNLPGAAPFLQAAQAAAEARASEEEGSSAAMAASDKDMESLVGI